ncbi:MAG TPA: CHASE3 domain-containing protein [Steroidobacteraceae bacterium]
MMALVVAASAVLTLWAGHRVLTIYGVAADRRQALDETTQLLASLADAETGQRGYLLTGDRTFLQPYEEAVRRLPQELAALAQISELDSHRFGMIRDLAEAKLAELKKVIELRDRNPGQAIAAVKQGEGKRMMDELRRRMAELQQEQSSLLGGESEEARRATVTRNIIFFATAVIDLLFLLWAYQKIAAILGERDRAVIVSREKEREANAQRELVTVTLASIGDGVIVSDTRGRITFMNKVAADLSGWPAEEAEGKTIGEVLNLINESTRARVENPAEKVIQSGAIVGLANHTILIRRDGNEIPIDDSGAPIRDREGILQGVVLVFRDFSEHKEAQQALMKAKEEAEAANAAKDRFIAMVSHELRTPLTPVLATISLWELGDDLPQHLQGDLRMLRQSVELEVRIIDDLLDLTRTQRGILTLKAEDTDACELIGSITELCQSEARGKQLALDLRLEAKRRYVHTDAARLQQIFWNVLRNAIKFTEAGGKIAISATDSADGEIVVTVSDTGVGMSPEMLSRLFVAFEQGEQTISRRYGGLGLGMAISSALAELMGGHLTAKSEGLGKGSTFTLRLPASEQPAEPHKPAINQPPTVPVSRRILLVEDHSVTAEVLQRILTARGHRVTAASSASAALRLVESEVFDLLICDIGLPDASGLDVVRAARERDPDIAAIAVTGFGTEEDIAASKAAGFDAHLTKPINIQTLETAIGTTCG